MKIAPETAPLQAVGAAVVRAAARALVITEAAAVHPPVTGTMSKLGGSQQQSSKGSGISLSFAGDSVYCDCRPVSTSACVGQGGDRIRLPPPLSASAGKQVPREAGLLHFPLLAAPLNRFFTQMPICSPHCGLPLASSPWEFKNAEL